VVKLEEIFVGGKDISRYITACFFGFDKEKKIKIVARGGYIKKAIDILAILIRDHIKDPEYEIIVKSEPFENRNVSAIEITLTGSKKEKRIEEEG
jgi:DNA-binding protein Alba